MWLTICNAAKLGQKGDNMAHGAATDQEKIKEMTEARAEAESAEDMTHDRFALQCLADNEVGDARLFNYHHDQRLIYDHTALVWFIWGGTVWAEDVTGRAMAEAFDPVVEQYAAEAQRQNWAATLAAKEGRDADLLKHKALNGALLSRIKMLQTVHRRRNVLILAAAGTGLKGNEWDRVPNVLACTNGVVDLRTGALRPGRPADYLKTACPTEYQGIDAPCLTWLRFLSEVFAGDQDLIDYLQRLFGYSLLGSVIEHILPILWGAGRNGKGTLLETLKHTLGDYAFKAESELLLEQKFAKASGAPNSGVLSLLGKRVVWVSETDEGRRLNTSRVKEMVGGDTLNARGVYARRHVEFSPSHLLLMLTNNKPQAPAGDYALWQRIHLIPFQIAFVHNPQKSNERKVDVQLVEKLKAEAPGILAWMVCGCLAYQAQGLNPPEVVRAATEAYRKDEDLMGHFLDDCCIQGPAYEVKAGVHFTKPIRSGATRTGTGP
jgi:putative DNA primase/helicase